MDTKETKGFVILNEEDLTIVHQLKEDNNDCTFRTEARVFESEEDADNFAMGRLHLWSVLEINFTDKFIQHKSNQNKKGE